jgi:kynurenine formamidase
MVTYPGLPPPVIGTHLAREDSRRHYVAGVEFHIGAIQLVGNTGTYLDVPFHRFADGYDLAALSLDRVAEVPAVVLRTGGAPLRAADVGGRRVAGRAVLVHTGWSRYWGTEAYGDRDHPYIDGEAAAALVDAGATIVGIDSLNVDTTSSPDRPVHTALLGAGIPIVEHLCALDRVPDQDFGFTAVPVKAEAMGTLPVRAYATWDDEGRRRRH